MIFTSEPSDKGSRRAREQAVNATMPAVRQRMNWSESVITWGPEDHPSVMPNPGSYALVVDAIVSAPLFSCKFTRTLIDGGSAINILYRDTMIKLGISESELEPSRTVFHGIVPGLSCTPLGRIRLEVVFGSEENFRREPIWFEVADLSSPYHVLLGSPAIAKFMMNVFQPYLEMKIPRPGGPITVCGDYKKSLECSSAGSKLADSLVIDAERRQLDKVVALAQAQMKAPLPSTKTKRSEDETSFQAAKDSKKIILDPSEPSKFGIIGARLSSK